MNKINKLLLSIFLLPFLVSFSNPIIEEIQPSYPGGMDALYSYIGKNMKYPKDARKGGIEGKVIISFEVNKHGTVENVELVAGIGHGCDAEAIRVMKESIAWKPGTTDGEVVRTKITLPISFALGKKEKK